MNHPEIVILNEENKNEKIYFNSEDICTIWSSAELHPITSGNLKNKGYFVSHSPNNWKLVIDNKGALVLIKLCPDNV